MTASSWFRAAAIASLALVTACRGKQSAPATGSGSAVAPTDPGAAVAQPTAGSNGVDVWDEGRRAPVKHSGPPPTKPADPAGVIARFDTECPAGPMTPACQDLRLQVERILLDSILRLRAAGKAIDLELYRVAARAELPQLACIGVNELAYAAKRSADDDAVFLAALDSPAPSVRNAVLNAAATLPAIAQLFPRAQQDPNRGVTNCFGGARDQAPGLQWAGGYPGAKFRYFASGPTLRWFTTTDPVDKVIAYFNQSGRPALTGEELTMAQAHKFADEANQITMGSGDDEAKAAAITKVLARMPADWKAPFHGIEGEIRFVMIGRNQAIGIFKDDVLHATSIVAPRAPAAPPTITDAKKLERENLQQAIFAD